MEPKISVIIPIYNVEKYVAECLNSVISQTYDHSKIECIIVNDCTPDRSMDVVRDVVDNYKNGGGEMTITVLNHDVNRGLSASRNTGMRRANGEFVFFVDSDDYLFPDALKTLMDYHLNVPEADMIIGNNHDEFRATDCYNTDKAKTICNMDALYTGNTKKITAWNSLIRHSLLLKNGIEFVEGIYFEDNVFSYQLFPLVKTAVIIPEVTYFYRKNPNGIILATRKEKAEKTVRDYLYIFNLFVEQLQGTVYVGRSIATIDLGILLYDFFRNNVQRIEHPDIAMKQYDALCKKLLSKHLKNGRIFLFTMSLMLVSPFNRLTKYRWFRRNYDRITQIFWLLAVVWDKVLNLTSSR
ncbi:MAG: glycosyltransferase family 2 protein [Prevotella sp.]